MRWFTLAGLHARSCSAAQVVRMAKLTSDERKSNAAAAQASVRGRAVPMDELTKRASSKSRRVGLYEREVIEELARGIHCEGQYALGPYNLDVFIHECSIAVEIYSTHPDKRRLARIHERTEYILNSGRKPDHHSGELPQAGFPPWCGLRQDSRLSGLLPQESSRAGSPRGDSGSRIFRCQQRSSE
jgi:hypothetical protein